MGKAEEIRRLCSIVALAADDAEFERAISKLHSALQDHNLKMQNLQTKAEIDISARKRKPKNT